MESVAPVDGCCADAHEEHCASTVSFSADKVGKLEALRRI
jgi:hypothetical protein